MIGKNLIAGQLSSSKYKVSKESYKIGQHVLPASGRWEKMTPEVQMEKLIVSEISNIK